MILTPVLSIRLVHLIALALAVGAATAKNFLLLRCRTEPAFVSTFLKAEGPITKQIVVGLALLTVSGIAYALMLGYGFTSRLIVKIALVAMVWVLGPVIDNVLAPQFKKTAPGPGEPATPEFRKALDRYLFWDVTATGLFYVTIILWVLTG